jgi:hypothetical protein
VVQPRLRSSVFQPSGRLLPFLTALALSVLGMVSIASAAQADSLTASVSVPTIATGEALTLTLSGDDQTNSDGSTPYLYVLVRSENGVGCQPTFGQDQEVAGTDNVTVFQGGYSDPLPDGSFSTPFSVVSSAGSYLVCAWIENDRTDGSGSGDVASQVVTASATTAFTVVNTDTLAISAATPRAGRPLAVTFSGGDSPYDGTGDTPYLYALIRKTNGVKCQPTFGQDQEVAGTDNVTVLQGGYSNALPDGSFSDPFSYTPSAGSYTVCAWVETDRTDGSGSGDVASQVVTASASATLSTATVVPKPKPSFCTVPGSGRATLAGMRRRLSAHHCSAGRVVRRYDARVKSGDVIKLSQRRGAHLSEKKKIEIFISRGRRHSRRRR